MTSFMFMTSSLLGSEDAWISRPFNLVLLRFSTVSPNCPYQKDLTLQHMYVCVCVCVCVCCSIVLHLSYLYSLLIANLFLVFHALGSANVKRVLSKLFFKHQQCLLTLEARLIPYGIITNTF